MKKSNSVHRKQSFLRKKMKMNNERSKTLNNKAIPGDKTHESSPFSSSKTEDLVKEAKNNGNTTNRSHLSTLLPISSTSTTENYTHNSNMDILDAALIFPYTNRPYEPRKKTIAEESKQWESLFDPQHTFGSFQHGIAKPVQHLFYKGKWPLDQEDIIGMAPNNYKLNINIPVIGNGEASTLFPTVPSPSLPNLDHLELHINNAHTSDQQEEEGGSNQIEILPCPSLSTFPSKLQLQEDEEAKYRDRLQLLNTIQIMGFNKETNDGTQSNPYKESMAARLQRQIRKKAERIKCETLVDSHTEEEDESVGGEVQIINGDSQLQVAIEPDTMLLPFTDNSRSPAQSTKDTSSLASLDDVYEKISFHAPKNEKDVEIPQEVKVPEIRKRNRPSFLFFAFGFLFPPLWVMGAFYVPPNASERTSQSKKIDLKWKKYSRNAFFAFFITLVSVIVLILMLEPEAVGFRSSKDEAYQGEERIVFDEIAPPYIEPTTMIKEESTIAEAPNPFNPMFDIKDPNLVHFEVTNPNLSPKLADV